MKKLVTIILMIVVVFTLGACSKKSQADVVKMLGEKVEKTDKFEVNAVMEIKELNKTHIFDVNVKYQKPNLYKVTLSNRDSKNVQIVLKNDEGVFVLTPALNKSFKFQSDWPLNSSQPYLFQSLVKDIMNDVNAIYEKQEGQYVFKTKVDYRRSRDLTSQKIILNSKTLFPKEVIVFDSTEEAKIHVLFSDVNYKPKFNDQEFDVEYSMTASINQFKDHLPTLEGRDIMYPTYLDEGTNLMQVDIIPINAGKRAIMTFGGASSFTLVEEFVNVKDEMDTQVLFGDPVLMGSGIGFLTETSLTWHENGIEFLVISESLDADQLYKIANSFMDVNK